MANLYANENFPLPVVEELRHLGHHVLTMREAGQTGQVLSDEDVLAFAQQEGRAILTLNRKHFVRLHQACQQHPGIVVCTFDPDFVGLAARVHTALSDLDTLYGKLVRVNRPHPDDAARLGSLD